LTKRIADPAEREKSLNYLMDILLADGYLVERNGRFAFRLEWLREYWRRRFAQ